jgi:hypothetical protein
LEGDRWGGRSKKDNHDPMMMIDHAIDIVNC